MIVDPWGQVLADCGSLTDQSDADAEDSVSGVVPGAGVVKVAPIDLESMRKVRREMPIWNHRRKDVYGALKARFQGDHAQNGIPPSKLNSLIKSANESASSDIVAVPLFRFGANVILSAEVVFHETPLAFAFVNRKPVLPGHVLVAPKRVVARMKEVSGGWV